MSEFIIIAPININEELNDGKLIKNNESSPKPKRYNTSELSPYNPMNFKEMERAITPLKGKINSLYQKLHDWEEQIDNKLETKIRIGSENLTTSPHNLHRSSIGGYELQIKELERIKQQKKNVWRQCRDMVNKMSFNNIYQKQNLIINMMNKFRAERKNRKAASLEMLMKNERKFSKILVNLKYHEFVNTLDSLAFTEGDITAFNGVLKRILEDHNLVSGRTESHNDESVPIKTKIIKTQNTRNPAITNLKTTPVLRSTSQFFPDSRLKKLKIQKNRVSKTRSSIATNSNYFIRKKNIGKKSMEESPKYRVKYATNSEESPTKQGNGTFSNQKTPSPLRRTSNIFFNIKSKRQLAKDIEVFEGAPFAIGKGKSREKTITSNTESKTMEVTMGSTPRENIRAKEELRIIQLPDKERALNLFEDCSPQISSRKHQARKSEELVEFMKEFADTRVAEMKNITGGKESEEIICRRRTLERKQTKLLTKGPRTLSRVEINENSEEEESSFALAFKLDRMLKGKDIIREGKHKHKLEKRAQSVNMGRSNAFMRGERSKYGIGNERGMKRPKTPGYLGGGSRQLPAAKGALYGRYPHTITQTKDKNNVIALHPILCKSLSTSEHSLPATPTIPTIPDIPSQSDTPNNASSTFITGLRKENSGEYLRKSSFECSRSVRNNIFNSGILKRRSTMFGGNPSPSSIRTKVERNIRIPLERRNTGFEIESPSMQSPMNKQLKAPSNIPIKEQEIMFNTESKREDKKKLRKIRNLQNRCRGLNDIIVGCERWTKDCGRTMREIHRGQRMFNKSLTGIEVQIGCTNIEGYIPKSSVDTMVEDFREEKKTFIYGPRGKGRFIFDTYNDFIKTSDLLVKTDPSFLPFVKDKLNYFKSAHPDHFSNAGILDE